MAPASSATVQVALRIRPPNNHDSSSIPARFQRSVIHASSSSVVTVDPSTTANGTATGSQGASAGGSTVKKQSFSFDQVHPPNTTQFQLFTATAQPLVSRFVEGFNCTILAYGQTSSGKTYSMTGMDLDADPLDPNNGMGIVPRAVASIFAKARQLKEERGGTWNYSVKGSFIEIYNEDLIDLLSLDEGGGKREVQIREDKDGHIIWGGLREVGVKNTNEVMTLIRKGTSIRRTNETDMNAQSSRSHAIFSLTLTQKKYTGSSSVPPRSSSPLPPGGRSPSRLVRPGSMYAPSSPAGRVSSPTSSRPGTPSFSSALGGRGGSSLRPQSSLGLHPSTAAAPEEDTGEWVTVVSKFHFVDLAGSERLKRTAAAGERIKEGISINGGLLALGNVISALGDPARSKSNTPTHVPYRDSKLTRLLQDSLGGNAHTLMIACISPAEYNVGETLNTLKYANRARNIKNHAVINQKEDGWDDTEWLQGQVTRLRKELKSIKDSGGVAPGDSSVTSDTVIVSAPVVPEGSSGKRVLAQMTELQNNYEDLREKFVERTEELTRLRRELGESQRGSTGGAVGGTAKYEEIVGPVIEEYEKTIAAMEAELNLNRAALRMTNEMVEEKEDELATITERHATTEAYVEELRGRVVKLSEREASTEAYVRDLEEKMKAHDEGSITTTTSMSDLKREVARFRDSDTHSGKYITDLEARLARSDESVIGLQQTVEKLEQDCERRRNEVELLQSRLDALKDDGDSWRNDLEERERKVRDLEVKLAEWEKVRKETGEQRAHLGQVVGEVVEAHRSLGSLSIPSATAPSTEPSPISPTSSSINKDDLSSESQLVTLQQTHTATLADLSAVTAKYRDALREISDLASQIQEAKLNDGLNDGSLTESTAPDSPALEKILDIPAYKRRSPRAREATDPQPSTSRRLFFRQAASTESLHARSLSQSQSLSQELSSARSRKASISSHGTSSSISHSPSTSPRLPNQSLRPNLSISLPYSPSGPQSQVSAGERSVLSLETEIMRLQEVLKERENEIGALEGSLRATQGTTVVSPVIEVQDEREDVFTNGATNGHTESEQEDLGSTHLSPKTMNKFFEVKRDLANGRPYSPIPDDASLDRLNELMLSMAQKESQHRETVDALNTQLVQVRRQHDDLTALSRDQAVNMSTEIEALQGKHYEDLATLETVQLHEAELLETLQQAAANHAAAIETIRAEHVEALRAKEAEVDALLTRTKDEHTSSLAAVQTQLSGSSNDMDRMTRDHTETLSAVQVEHDATLKALRGELAGASSSLEKAHLEHQDAFGKLKSEHEEKLRSRLQEVNEVLQRTRKEHEVTLTKVQGDHEESLKQKDAEASAILQRTEEEYYDALTKLRGDHSAALQKQSADAAATLERLREEHAGQLRIVEKTREGTLSASDSARTLALEDLQSEHASAISRKESSFAEELANLKADHERAMTTKEGDYSLQYDRVRLEQETVIAKFKEQCRIDVDRMSATSTASQAEAASAVSNLQAQESKMLELEQQQVNILHELQAEHESALGHTQSEHEGVLARTLADHAEALAHSRSGLEETLARAQAKHETAFTLHKAEHEDTLSALQKGHDEALARVQAEHTGALKEAAETSEKEAAALLEAHAEDMAGLKAQLKEALSFQQNSVGLVESHSQDLAKLRGEHQQALSMHQGDASALVQAHTEDIVKLRAQHQEAITAVNASLIAAQQKHVQDLADSRAATERLIVEHKDHLTNTIESLELKHSQERDTLRRDHDLLVQELESHKGAADDFALIQDETRSAHEAALKEKVEVIDSVNVQLSTAHSERDQFANEVAKLRAELDQTRGEQSKLIQEASKRESTIDELEKYRSLVADIQEDLQRVKDEKDNLQSEKSKQDLSLRELQAQVARSASPNDNMGMRNMAFSRASGPGMKLPPPTPPPSIPPPPAPKGHAANGDNGVSMSSHSSGPLSSSSSRDSQSDSPLTSIGNSFANGGPTAAATTAAAAPDPKMVVRLDQQTKQIDEQEAMIKTLNKQLTHCESDLQAHMDLVATVEGNLGDSEKNLRKARMQATELARERDSLNAQINDLRNALADAKREVVSVRRSITEEKQSFEHKLEEERKQKERVRSQLDSRMEELSKKKSKFACA